ncbi:hypothetical protein [Fidelibacter multiformis]|uniref:hypothetical protein n=1 Tax=Fidelibacter multiformis TaxID=3377529 RepID=UPI0037DC7B88
MKKLFCLFFLLLIGTYVSGQSAFDTQSVFEADEASSVSPLTWSGYYEFEPRFFIKDLAPADHETIHVLDLSFQIDKEKIAMKGDFRVHHTGDVNLSLNELYVSAYLGRVQIHAGNQVIVWGKGDELHILDVINADDYWDFFFPDYLRRRRGENMVRINTIIGPYDWNTNLEIVYTPGFSKMTFPASGPWQPPVYQALYTILEAYPGIVLSEESYDELEDGQLAARWTQTVGRFDLGFSVYRGKLRTPSVRFTPDPTSSPDPTGTITLLNNPVTVIGMEGGTALGKLNLRGEAGRYITADTKGNKPYIHNSKWSLLVGGDINLPIHHLNLNIQYQKDFVPEEKMNPMLPGFEDIAKGLAIQLGLEPALFEGGILNNYYDFHLLTTRLADSFFREQFKPEIQWVYNMEAKDYMITLKLNQKLTEGLYVTGIYRRFEGKPGTLFGQYNNNDFISLRMEYQF